VKLRLPIAVVMLFLLILILPFFVSQVESDTSTNTLYAHAETTTIGGVNYYLHKLSSADGPATTLSQSAISIGRKLMGRWVYPLNGIVSIPSSTWTVTYRAMKSASASSVVAHGDIDMLIRKSDNTIRTTIATNVANSPSLTLTNTWQTLTGTYNWAAYTVVDQTDYLEVAYYIEVTTPQSSKSVRLLVDDSTLPLADQTKVENVMFTYPNRAPVLDPIGPKSVNELELLTFTATATDSDVPIQTLTFSLGAGAPAGTSITSAGVFTWTPTEAQGPGVYSIRIIVSDGIAQDYEDITVTVNEVNVAPIASFTYSPSDPLIYDIVTFDASASYDPDGSIVTYGWDFGDGNVTTVTSPIITHVYVVAASTVNYSVTLTVTGNGGSTSSVTDIVPVTNPTILRVSLPDGTYTDPESDHWLSQCWLLNITGPSGTFTIRISNNHTSITSNYTRLIIVLNNASYEAFNSLTVGSTTILKGSFVYGTPTPYGLALTWKEDVYPAWFSDIYVVGTIGPKSYKDVEVFVTFTNATGVRMHFDAYGSTGSSFPPTNLGHVTHNPHEYDSTVLFWPPPVVKYQLTVRTSGLGTYTTKVYNGTTLLGTATDATPYIGWFDEGSLILLNIDSPIAGGSRFVFTQWSGDATGSSRPLSLTMTASKDITANYKTQHQITVTASPGGALGGNFKVTYVQCGTTYTNVEMATQWTEWVDANTDVTVSEPQDIINVSPGMRYKFDSYSPSASVTMDQAKTITLVYKTQYYLTVKVDPPGITTIPGEGWYNATLTVSLLAPPVPNYEFKNWTVDGSFAPGNPINVPMDNPHTAIAYYTPISPLSVSITPTTAKIKIGESVTFTCSVSGGKPPYTSYQWYLNGSAVSGATSPTWTFTPVTVGYYIVYLNVTDSAPKTAKSNEASVTVAPPLTVSISPTSASILVGQSVTFTSTVSGGYSPYSYQWYLNGALVSGASASTWTLTPTTSGIYYVYLKVTDDNNNVAQSETARITVSTVPVGGYSISFAKPNTLSNIIAYMAIVALSSAILSSKKRKRK